MYEGGPPCSRVVQYVGGPVCRRAVQYVGGRSSM